MENKLGSSDTLKLSTNSNIREGSAEIIGSPGERVFYNPVQEFNRDLSVLVLQVFSRQFHQNENTENGEKKPFRILEALSATGLRSIRYAKEISNVTQIIANDISDIAVENIKKNVNHNKVEKIVQICHSNAISLMFENSHPSKRFEAVDLDPYGSPSQFLDSAVQCVSEGGILMVTCTDMAILCGNFPEVCFLKYGAVSLKSQAHHEMAIRIILHCIQSHASRQKRYIVPLLSVSADFYVRVFVKIFTGAQQCKNITSKLSVAYKCTGCDAITLQPLGILKKSKNNEKKIVHGLPNVPPVGPQCVNCSGKFHMGGPIWNDAIHDLNFVAELLKSKEINELGTSKRLLGMLSLIQEELYDVPLYYKTPNLCGIIKCTTIPIMMLRSAILNGGYRVSFSHAAKESVKTDAPMSFIWDIFRKWVEENPVKTKNIIPGSPGDIILNTPIKNEVDFSLRPDANPISREMKLTRYQENPQRFWGPGSRATTMNLTENPKKSKNQNKKSLARKSNILFDEIKSKEPKLNESLQM